MFRPRYRLSRAQTIHTGVFELLNITHYQSSFMAETLFARALDNANESELCELGSHKHTILMDILHLPCSKKVDYPDKETKAKDLLGKFLATISDQRRVSLPCLKFILLQKSYIAEEKSSEVKEEESSSSNKSESSKGTYTSLLSALLASEAVSIMYINFLISNAKLLNESEWWNFLKDVTPYGSNIFHLAGRKSPAVMEKLLELMSATISPNKIPHLLSHLLSKEDKNGAKPNMGHHISLISNMYSSFHDSSSFADIEKTFKQEELQKLQAEQIEKLKQDLVVFGSSSRHDMSQLQVENNELRSSNLNLRDQLLDLSIETKRARETAASIHVALHDRDAEIRELREIIKAQEEHKRYMEDRLRRLEADNNHLLNGVEALQDRHDRYDPRLYRDPSRVYPPVDMRDQSPARYLPPRR